MARHITKRLWHFCCRMIFLLKPCNITAKTSSKYRNTNSITYTYINISRLYRLLSSSTTQHNVYSGQKETLHRNSFSQMAHRKCVQVPQWGNTGKYCANIWLRPRLKTLSIKEVPICLQLKERFQHFTIKYFFLSFWLQYTYTVFLHQRPLYTMY